MKTRIVALLFAIPLAAVWAEDGNYRESLRSLQDRFRALETEYHDYRKPQPRLTPEQENEMLCLQGRLLRDDPIGALSEQITADIRALEALPSRSEPDMALIETLKNLLAVVSGLDDRASTRAQAEEHATLLRQFVARRDYDGAVRWAETK